MSQPRVQGWRHRFSARLCGLGGVLVVTMTMIARVDARSDVPLFLAMAALASTLYLLALATVFRASPATPKGLWACLALAALCRVPLVLAEPTMSDDIYRYVWDGRVQRLGHSPYMSAPADPALRALQTPVTRLANHPNLPTVYPPAAQWFFRGVAWIAESVLAFKLAFLACDALVVLLLLRWLALAGHSRWRVLIYAWNPLVILEVAGSGHVDVLGALLLFLSFLALSSRFTLVAAVSFVAAVEVKFLPVVLAPLLWRRIGLRDAAVAGVVAVGFAVPFLDASAGLPVGSLPTYLENWRFNGPAFDLVQRVVPGKWLPLLPVIGGVLVAMWFRRQPASPSAWAWPMAVALMLMPAVFPWYLLWLVPFLGPIATLPLLVWTQTVIVTYAAWWTFAETGRYQVPWWVVAVEYGSVAAVAIWAAARTPRVRHDAPALGDGADA